MARKQKAKEEKSIQDVIDDLGVYPPEAFDFVQHGLSYTVQKLHADEPPEVSHHVSGQQLCDGLKELALDQWGLMARTVLYRWGITSTYDFGRIVFALVDNGFLRKTDEDSVDDFRNVYDFNTAFEEEYRIECKS